MAYSASVSNALRLDLFKVIGGVTFHAAADAAVTAANAYNVATLVTLVTALADAFNAHVPDVCDLNTGAGVHGADSGHRITFTADDLGSARTILSELDSKMRAHAESLPAHFTPDRTNISWYSPTDGGVNQACYWANAWKVAMNAHFAAALESPLAT